MECDCIIKKTKILIGAQLLPKLYSKFCSEIKHQVLECYKHGWSKLDILGGQTQIANPNIIWLLSLQYMQWILRCKMNVAKIFIEDTT